MISQRGYLLDSSLAKVAVLDVTRVGDLYSGTICLDATPPELEHLFEEFEEMVGGQVFSVADEIEEKIGRLRLRVAFGNDPEAEVSNLQVYPTTNRVSFGIRQLDPSTSTSTTSNESVVHRDPDIMGGIPVFVGTRVPLQNLLDYLCGGDPLSEFLDDFPSVSREQAVAALRQAAQALVDLARPA